MALTPAQIEQLTQAAQRLAGGTASASDRKNLAYARSRFGWTPTTQPATTTASAELQALVDRLTPAPVDDTTLSSRFASLFDPTFNQNTTDINTETDKAIGRFNEDASLSSARLDESRRLASAKMREEQAAGGASGQLADFQLGQTLKPYDQQAQDAATTSARFSTDTEEQRRKRLLANQQARATALAQYTNDPNNRYEFSF